MASNGRLTASQLARIPGSGPYGRPQLRNDAAKAYNALHNYSMRRWGISMALHEGSVGRAYRSYQRQVTAKRVYGSNAATPGYSNHGWGIAVDLMTRQQRWVIDRVGHLFGFSKSWSDAAWEWWHIKYRPGRYRLVKKYHWPTLRRDDRGRSVKRLQRRLRAHGYKKVPGRRYKRRGYGHFGRSTLAAVKAFQRRKGLKADGIVGPATWKKLIF